MTPAPVKPVVSGAIVGQIDARVGTILTVRDVPGAERLVQLEVDFGDRIRSVVVGMKTERENPAEITGRQALFIVNLEPRRIRGILSEAMLFDVGYEDGISPAMLIPEHPVPNGVRAG
jgi:tRNA-binding protein